MITARERFIVIVQKQLGKPALWAAKGPEAFDCSGLVTWCFKMAGGVDFTKLLNANGLGKATRPLVPGELALPGDLILFDAEKDQPAAPGHGIDDHVGIVIDERRAIDAAGATSRITTIEGAIAAGAKVRWHDRYDYRGSFRALHRNLLLDDLDRVTR